MKTLLKSFLLITAAIIPKDYTAQKRSDSIDTFIKHTMQELKIPGLQLAIIRNDKVDQLSSYGLANIEHQVATKNNTLFSINSMTKAFVGVAIMQLQEQGKLKTDDPI